MCRVANGFSWYRFASEASEGSMSACGVRDTWIDRYNSSASGSGSSNSSAVTVLMERTRYLSLDPDQVPQHGYRVGRSLSDLLADRGESTLSKRPRWVFHHPIDSRSGNGVLDLQVIGWDYPLAFSNGVAQSMAAIATGELEAIATQRVLYQNWWGRY